MTEQSGPTNFYSPSSLTPNQRDAAIVRAIKKEKWVPKNLDGEFRDTLDLAFLQDKYGLKHHTENYALSARDLQKIVDKKRNEIPLTPAEQKVIEQLEEPIDSHSGLIWKDRQFKKSERDRNANVMNGRIGNVAFDPNMQESMEKRFL
jgi:hypothetical protein